MITDPVAIQYSRESLRPAADKIARSYYRLAQLNDQWNATTGTNDEVFALLQPEIVRVATLVANTWMFVWKANRLWDALSINALIPNDSAELLFDNDDATAPSPSLPVVSGQDLRRLKNRMEEFQHWLDAAQFVNDGGVTLPIDYANLNDVLRMTEDGSKTPTTAWGRQVAVIHAEEIRTEYEVTNTAYLSQILRASARFTEL